MNLAERLIANSVDGRGGCRLWLGKPGTHGYGSISVDGKRDLVHRVAYRVFVGPIPDELTVDHIDICRVRLCIEPAHLRLLTNEENGRRNGQSVQTHCKHGHEFTPENTRVDAKGHRYCRACARDNDRRRRPRKNLTAAERSESARHAAQVRWAS